MRPTIARVVALAVLLPCAVQAEVFVNEIHYDNASTDVGEAIEVVATAGEDLTLYSLYFYNGSNGGLSSSTAPNPQSLPAGSSATCGASVNFSVLLPNQIENGGPDGIALVGPGGTVVQFLSYEGSFAATGGPANGTTSTDIGVAEDGSTTIGHSLQISGNGTTYVDFAWQAPAIDTFGECNTGQTFGAAIDNPPTLAASTPVTGGTLAANAALSLTFSEPVDVTGEWFTLGCDSTGPLGTGAFTVSGGPTTFSLTPLAELIEGDACLLMLAPLVITDQDGDADALDPPYDVAFDVVAPIANAPPEVVATVPVDGASTFPIAGDLSVTFSEPVAIASGAFSLDCVASTGIVLSHPASGTTVSIDTGTALAHEDTCTFSIDAALVTDADGAQLVAFAAIDFTVASDNSGAYYDQVNDSSPEQLRCSLHETINDHTKLPYTAASTDTWDVLKLADEDPADPAYILDTYRNAKFEKADGGNDNYDREHTWPKTYGFSDTGTPGAATDTHMLHLTYISYNGSRGSKPYADCTSGCSELATEANHGIGGGGGGDSNWVVSGASENLGSFEPWDHVKGNMARAVMYMAIRYEGDGAEPDLELTDTRNLITSGGSGGKHYMGLLTHVLAWHAADPPDARELARNEVIYSFQNNRNPFIDHPEWGTLALFQSSQPAECILGTPDPNTAPVAVDDAYAPTEDEPLAEAAVAGVLANDSDADDDAMVAALVSNATNGVVSLQTDGSFTYTANADFCGEDSFTYNASDAESTSATALVALAVACVADAPVALADAAEFAEDGTLSVVAPGVLDNDTDADGDELTAVVVSGPIHASAFALSADGSYSYTPSQHFNGSDSFSYRADDGSATSEPVYVTLTITAVNDAPQATATLPDRNAVEGDDVAYATADAFTDVDGDTLSFTAAGMPASLSIDPANGTISGTLVAGDAAAGPYTITVTASDDDGAEAALDFTLSVDPPPADHIFADGFEQPSP